MARVTGAHLLYEDYTYPQRTGREAREVGAREAFQAIPDGGRVLIPTLSGLPQGLLDAMDAERDVWSDLELVGGIMMRHIAPLDHVGAPFRFATWQFSRSYAPALEAGQLAVIPARYSQTVSMFAPDGPSPSDAVMVQVSPPGPEGRFSLGPSGGATIDMVRSAKSDLAHDAWHR